MNKFFKKLIIGIIFGVLPISGCVINAQNLDLKASIALKSPGNNAIEHPLNVQLKNNQILDAHNY